MRLYVLPIAAVGGEIRRLSGRGGFIPSEASDSGHETSMSADVPVLSLDDGNSEEREYTIRGIVSNVEFTETEAMRSSEPSRVITSWRRMAEYINFILDESRDKLDSSPSGNGWQVAMSENPNSTSWIERDSLNTEYRVGPNLSKRHSGSSVYYCRSIPPETPDHTPASSVARTDSVPILHRLGRALFGASRRVHVTAPNLVIKYDSTCLRIHRGNEAWKDTLFSEYIIMKSIEILSISPRAVSLSGSTFPSLVEWKYDPRIQITEEVTLDGSLESFCVENRAHVRALIMERAGKTLSYFRSANFYKSIQYMQLGVRIGLRTIELLETLHDSGFVHGDVHVGNVALREPASADSPSGSPDLVLIDFGRSRFFPAEFGKTFDPSHPSGWESYLNGSLLSPWQFLQNNRSGRRDDIYRAIELVISVLSPNDEFRDFLRMDKNSIYAGKLYGRFFSNPCYLIHGRIVGICQLYTPRVNQRTCQRAMDNLGEALEHVRGIPHSDSRPEYARIKEYFHKAIRALGG
jgi:hypothetical protein